MSLRKEKKEKRKKMMKKKMMKKGNKIMMKGKKKRKVHWPLIIYKYVDNILRTLPSILKILALETTTLLKIVQKNTWMLWGVSATIALGQKFEAQVLQKFQRIWNQILS
jgi:hypothetical protein